MQYLALACDYDGTLAHDGAVDEATLAALRRCAATGRRLVLITGRELEDLGQVFPHLALFQVVVAENGGLLYRPATREVVELAAPPPPAFAAALRARGAQPLSVGRVVVATREPYDQAVFELIEQLGLDLEVSFNKGAVMVLPPGIDKGSGFRAALRELGLTAEQTVGVGDAENDLPFLRQCGWSVAVANALPTVKDAAGLVTQGARGAGVVELIDLLPDSLPGPEQEVINKVEEQLVTDLLSVLDARARYAVEQRFGLNDGRKRSYREVGEELGVTAEAARRLVKRAVSAVREQANEAAFDAA